MQPQRVVPLPVPVVSEYKLPVAQLLPVGPVVPTIHVADFAPDALFGLVVNLEYPTDPGIASPTTYNARFASFRDDPVKLSLRLMALPELVTLRTVRSITGWLVDNSITLLNPLPVTLKTVFPCAGA